MAFVEPVADAQHDAAHAVASSAPHGLAVLHAWVTTVDHKKIGLLYVLMSLVFLVIGGIEALLMRWQLLQAPVISSDPMRSINCSPCTAPPWSSSWGCRS